MSGFRDLVPQSTGGRLLAAAGIAAGAYALYRGARALHDHMYPARAHVRDMRAAGIDLSPITPEALQAQRQQLRTRRMIPATSMHDNITLRREAGQSAEHFTDFMVDSRRALHTIASQPQGHALLTDLEHGPHYSFNDRRSRVVISDSRFTPTGYNPNAGNGAGAFGALNTRERLPVDSTPGFGEASWVFFNPTITRSDGPRPAFVGLAHELVHAQRNQVGVAVERHGDFDLGAVRDELETVGLLPTPQTQTTTENAIRQEHGIGPRQSYSGQTRQSYVQALREESQRRQAQRQQLQPQSAPDGGHSGGGTG